MSEKNSVPHVQVTPKCPILHEKAGVGLDLNIFRGQEQFTECTLLHTGEECCHECLTDPKTREDIANLLQIERAKHLADIAPLSGVIV